MAFTQIADVVVPEVFMPYLEQKITEKSAFVQSGVAVTHPEVQKRAQGGGALIQMPFWNPIGGDDHVSSDTNPLPLDKIASGQDVAVKLYREKGLEVNVFATELAGDDPLDGVANKMAQYWVRREQQALLSTLKGIFANALASTHVLDITGETNNTISAGAILDAKALLGDIGDELNAIAMHSAQYVQLQKLDLIQYERLSDQDPRVPFFMGYRVIVDDTMPVDVDATTGDKTYHTYLFSGGAVARAHFDRENPIEFDRDSLMNNDIVITRRGFLLHVPGVKWATSNTNPDNTALATGTNWARVYEPKNIRVVCLKTR